MSTDAGGLQNERTTLAWQRTALSLAGVGAFVAKQSGSMGIAAALLAVVALVVGWMVTRADQLHRTRHGALRDGDPVVALHHVTAVAVLTTALAASSFLIVVT